MQVDIEQLQKILKNCLTVAGIEDFGYARLRSTGVQLNVTTTTFNKSYEGWIDGEGGDEFDVYVEAKRLQSIASILKKGAIEITTKNGKVFIKAGDMAASMPYRIDLDFSLAIPPQPFLFEINGNEFFEAIECVAGFIAESGQSASTSLCVCSQDGKLTLMGSDHKKMARYTFPITLSEDFSLLIPWNIASRPLGMLKDEGTVKVSGKNVLVIDFDNARLQLPLIDGTFPDLSRFFNAQGEVVEVSGLKALKGLKYYLLELYDGHATVRIKDEQDPVNVTFNVTAPFENPIYFFSDLELLGDAAKIGSFSNFVKIYFNDVPQLAVVYGKVNFATRMYDQTITT